MKKRGHKKEISSYEFAILKIMWIAGRPLLASEIGRGEYGFTRFILKRMREKELVEICDFAKHGDLFGVCYQPTISWDEFESVKYMYEETSMDSLIERYIEKLNADSGLRQLEKRINEMRENLRKPDGSSGLCGDGQDNGEEIAERLGRI